MRTDCFAIPNDEKISILMKKHLTILELQNCFFIQILSFWCSFFKNWAPKTSFGFWNRALKTLVNFLKTGSENLFRNSKSGSQSQKSILNFGNVFPCISNFFRPQNRQKQILLQNFSSPLASYPKIFFMKFFFNWGSPGYATGSYHPPCVVGGFST